MAEDQEEIEANPMHSAILRLEDAPCRVYLAFSE
ncbi:hypothetical protein OIHEL45_14420 [Sulfitobacter indolifex HEL-45]|uniref:Uncharacterized protein n=1 Tax=Sulfitobacter indolifex HEL-45 TaxID=391624 RepID=A0ABM9X5X6_9RHOB|nr:hypothetical protein OIHEL45_14420 [Sulfitobacter indolifex HEL-45]